MTRGCAFDPSCSREPVATSATGIVHANCAAHEREAMSFFGERWHDQARTGVLRPSIVGGLPVTGPDSPSGASATAVSPEQQGRRPRQGASASAAVQAA